LRHVRVVLDAGRLRAALRGGDGDLAVARAQVVVDVVRAELRHGEHARHDFVGCRHPDDVLARLADVRLGWLLRLGIRLGVQRKGNKEGGRGQRGPAGDVWHCYSYGRGGKPSRYQSVSAAWSARRERSPRASVTCPACDQPFIRSTTKDRPELP